MSPEEYKELLDWRKSVDSELAQLRGGYTRVSDTIDLNTNITLGVKETLEKLAKDLGSFPEFLSEGRTSLKFITKMRQLVTWLAYNIVLPTASAFAAIYFYKHGFLPEWFENLVEFLQDLTGLGK